MPQWLRAQLFPDTDKGLSILGEFGSKLVMEVHSGKTITFKLKDAEEMMHAQK